MSSHTEYMQFRTQITAILSHLSPRWHLDPLPATHTYWASSVTARHPDLPECGIHFRHRAGRLIITPAYPHNFHPYDYTDSPRITVSAARTPQSIAADIERRFLEACFTACRAALERQRQAQIAVANTNAALQELAAIVGAANPRLTDASLRQGRVSLSTPGSIYGSFQAVTSAAPTFYLDIRHVPLPLPLARRLAHVIAAYQRAADITPDPDAITTSETRTVLNALLAAWEAGDLDSVAANDALGDAYALLGKLNTAAGIVPDRANELLDEILEVLSDFTTAWYDRSEPDDIDKLHLAALYDSYQQHQEDSHDQE